MPTILAILSAYLRSATDGWLLAATSVRDLYASDATCAAEAGGDFAAEAERLGEATAEVHRALAEAFGTEELPPGAYRDLAVQMQGRLDGRSPRCPSWPGTRAWSARPSPSWPPSTSR
jgi:maltokinase